MLSRQIRKGPAFDGVNVDALRARLEQELPLPGVIAITSAAAEDGKELIARALAYSYALTGYSTLFIDASRDAHPPAEPQGGLVLTYTTWEASPRPESGKLAVLVQDDLRLRRTPSVRSIKAGLENLRANFDCVVISTKSCTADPFAAAIAATADAHLVTVKKGRRQIPEDARLASELERAAGSRFLGVVGFDPAVTKANSSARVPAPKRLALDWPRQPKPGFFARVVHALISRLSGRPATGAAEPRPAGLPNPAELQPVAFPEPSESRPVALPEASGPRPGTLPEALEPEAVLAGATSQPQRSLPSPGNGGDASS